MERVSEVSGCREQAATFRTTHCSNKIGRWILLAILERTGDLEVAIAASPFCCSFKGETAIGGFSISTARLFPL